MWFASFDQTVRNCVVMERNCVVPLKIACIHQGYEPYGSDWRLAQSVAALRSAYSSAEIEIVLSRTGPFVGLLESVASSIVPEPLWILGRKTLPRLMATGTVTLPLALMRAARRLACCDLTYINASVITDHTLAPRAFPGKILHHIREILEGVMRPILRGLAPGRRSWLNFNSRPTRDALAPPAARLGQIIIADPAAWTPADFDAPRPLKVLMQGRINRVRDQEVLLEALASLAGAGRQRLAVGMVGSAFEDHDLDQGTRHSDATLGLEAMVGVEPFLNNPGWVDILVVLSRRPGSLGRVAIEAMALGRPPLVSAIRGLREAVADRLTGRLLPPRDEGALASALTVIIEDPAPMAVVGRARFLDPFRAQAAAVAIFAVAADMIAARSRMAVAVDTGASQV